MQLTDKQRSKLKKACDFLKAYPEIIPLVARECDRQTREFFGSLSDKEIERFEKVIQKNES